LDEKIAKLLPILLLKYQKKEPITRAEILDIVDGDYHVYFPLIVSLVCECMCLGFGIDVREVDPPGHTYVLIPLLGLTYNGMLGNDQIIPKINLLIVVLTIIFMKDNCASEEDIRKVLRMREKLPQSKHIVIREPWKFITEDLVREQYLEYRQVHNSDPTRYEFLWGPRAHAETSKMKVLEHLAKVNRRDPRSYPRLYEKALREDLQEAMLEPLQDMDVPQFLRNVLLNDKLRKLVSFLLRKYQKKEQVTLEEMLHVVHDDYREHFPLIFREVCESICLGFGIELREVDPPGHTYVLVPVLGLTYNGILDNDDQIIPKFDLLIYTLTAVFMRGNQVSEKVLKKQVIKWGMLALKEHIVIRELWKFITEDLVQEQYLVYRQVPDSDPANYEFLWGPRAHAETTQMKVLEHVAKLNRADPRSYPQLYDQALREE
ncbi:Melanoma-associated antigen 10, partial [Heterocephalus glaber]